VIVAGALLAAAAVRPSHHAVRAPTPRPKPAPSSSEVVAPRHAVAVPTGRHVAVGAAIGTLTIPRLHESETFRQGVDASVLQYGPGHYPMTHLPGQAGTVAIAGHRTTHTHPFLHLNALRGNDRIFITAFGRRFTYRVYAMKIVRPTEVWVLMLRSHVPRLVLTACHPPHLATFRLVVFARQIGPLAGTPVARR
jgi:LPXTG-site transpeptidase (sortase) family protein